MCPCLDEWQRKWRTTSGLIGGNNIYNIVLEKKKQSRKDLQI